MLQLKSSRPNVKTIKYMQYICIIICAHCATGNCASLPQVELSVKTISTNGTIWIYLYRHHILKLKDAIMLLMDTEMERGLGYYTRTMDTLKNIKTVLYGATIITKKYLKNLLERKESSSEFTSS